MVTICTNITHFFKQKVLVNTLFLFAFNWLAGVNSFAQNSCQNSDFMMGDFTNWTGYTSVYHRDTPLTNVNIPYYYTQGIVNQRHTIITNSTPDPFTCNNVMTIPPGENTSVRLGNGGLGMPDNGVRWQIDILEYNLAVTPANALLIYKYAVVLQDPNNTPHDEPIKPRFKVSIVNDATGDLIDPICGEYNVTSDTTVEGFRDCVINPAMVNSTGDVRYRAWTTVGVDLRNYIGQNVTLRFETWDCGLGGHFGYAYISAKCDSMGITAQNCSANNVVTLTAPPGFTYQWSTGQSTQTIDIPNAVSGDTVSVELTTSTGCSSDVYTILNPTEAVADFSTSSDTVCLNDPIQFNDSSYSFFPVSMVDIPIISWNWDFGDGSTSTQQNPTHTYASNGTFAVTLEIETAEGCIISVTKNVEIMPLPVPDFAAAAVCVGDSTAFQDQSLILTGNVVQWDWDFNDNGATSTVKSPGYTFSVDGTFNVKLIATSDFGCVDSITKPVDVYSPPVANFDMNNACEETNVLFTNLSTNTNPNDPLDSYQWNFGDNTSLSNGVNPTYIYADSGIFDVSLITTTVAGCKHDTVIPITIYPKPLPDFQASFACANSTVFFSNLTLDKDSIVSWLWDFGDGSPTDIQDSTSHIYSNSGFYNVKLIATTSQGCKDSVIKTVEVVTSPVANFTYDKSCFGNITTFTNSSYVNIGSLTDWYWTINDGNITSTNQNISHTFSSIGSFDVTLAVESDLGCTDTMTQVIYVANAPQPNFSADTACIGTRTVLTDLTTPVDPNYNWVWDFGDFSPNVNGQHQTHSFGAADTFMVKLTVTNGGCFNDTVIPVLVKPSPVADFVLPPFCMNQTASPQNTSTPIADILGWEWTFSDDNSVDNNHTPVHTFDITDNLDIRLIAYGNNGCNDTTTQNVNLHPNPTANFSTTDICWSDTISFRDLSTIATGSVIAWNWNFGDGDTSSLKDPSYSYSNVGAFNVTLEVESNNGCFDTIVQPVNVWPLPEANFTVNDICIGEYASFTNTSVTPPLDSITSNVWNFGDGSLQKQDVNPNYRYLMEGTYNVSLYTTTQKGCLDSITFPVTVHPKPVLDFSPTSVCLNELTSFQNLSTSISAVSIWQWDFGDGSPISSDFEPNHSYATVGVFDAQLKGISNYGCTDSVKKSLTVYHLPEINFEADHYDGCAPECFDFTDFSFAQLDTITKWLWNFGDGASSSNQNPEHCYNEPGVYDVSLEVGTIKGCVNQMIWDSMIITYPSPVSSFTPDPYETTEDDPIINFIDLSQGAIKWIWDFGDGNNSDEPEPSNLYYQYGTYNVQQIVENEYGCRDTSTQVVTIDRTYRFFAPNTFSPNGDGVNDLFFPETVGINPDPGKYTFAIFDRWGLMIWKTHDINEGWDGKHNNWRIIKTGERVQIDTYIWKVWAEDQTNSAKQHVFIGHVSIIR